MSKPEPVIRLYGKTLLVAPHPDDEIIGAWTLLVNDMIDEVVFLSYREGIEYSAQLHGFKYQVLSNAFELDKINFNAYDNVLVPHPLDHHPEHRIATIRVQSLFDGNIYYYSTDMNIPWAVKPLGKHAETKYQDLISCYPSQKSEADVNHYWWMFEGITSYPSLPKITVEYYFLGYHRYPESERKYLRFKHQHLFKVLVELSVYHLYRDVEFHDLRDKLKEIIDTTVFPDTASVEQMAEIIWTKLKRQYGTYIRVYVCEEGNMCGAYGDPLW